MLQNYAESERRVLLSEGGYTNDPRDPGGPTNWGITLEDARLHWKSNATAEDVRAMPRSVAEGIYKSKYWDALNCDQLPSGVDYTVFDYGVNSGIGRAGRVLRAALGLPRSDWHVTADVIAKAKAADPVKLVDAINTERMAFLMALPTWSHFGLGWSRRVVSVKGYSEYLAKHVPEREVSGAKPQTLPSGNTPAPEPHHPEPTPGKAEGDDQPIVIEVLEDILPSWLTKRALPKPKRPSMWKSKTGWIAAGLGTTGVSQGLDKLNSYADQFQALQTSLTGLHVFEWLRWLVEHPAVLVPIAVVAGAAFIWADHRKYKTALQEAQNPT